MKNNSKNHGNNGNHGQGNNGNHGQGNNGNHGHVIKPGKSSTNPC